MTRATEPRTPTLRSNPTTPTGKWLADQLHDDATAFNALTSGRFSIGNTATKVIDAIPAIEAEAAAAPPIDVERLAEAIQSTILTSPDEYTRPEEGGAYRRHWADLLPHEKRHVLQDAKALAAEYARLSGPPPEPKPDR